MKLTLDIIKTLLKVTLDIMENFETYIRDSEVCDKDHIGMHRIFILRFLECIDFDYLDNHCFKVYT